MTSLANLVIGGWIAAFKMVSPLILIMAIFIPCAYGAAMTARSMHQKRTRRAGSGIYR